MTSSRDLENLLRDAAERGIRYRQESTERSVQPEADAVRALDAFPPYQGVARTLRFRREFPAKTASVVVHFNHDQCYYDRKPMSVEEVEGAYPDWQSAWGETPCAVVTRSNLLRWSTIAPVMRAVLSRGLADHGDAWVYVNKGNYMLLDRGHYAVIAAMLRPQGVEPGKDFGVAPSTLEYERGNAACAR